MAARGAFENELHEGRVGDLAEHTQATCAASACQHVHLEGSTQQGDGITLGNTDPFSARASHPKGGDADLSAELAAALTRHRAASPKTGRVFLQHSGRPALAKHLYGWTEAAMERAGIPKKKGVKLHVMRHSACSALAAMGAPMIAIQSLAGHESPQTTAKYMHLAAGVQAGAVRLFDQERGATGARVDSEPQKGQVFPAKPSGATGDRTLRQRARQASRIVAKSPGK